MSSSCLPEPPSDCDNNTGGGDDFNAAASRGSPVTGLSVLNSQDSEMQMQLARLSRLMAPAGGSSTALPLECDAGFESSSLCGNFNNVDPESDDRPTAKQKRVARVVMAVAFILLSMCFVLIVVTLSMSDHIDRMVVAHPRFVHLANTIAQLDKIYVIRQLAKYEDANSSKRPVDNSIVVLLKEFLLIKVDPGHLLGRFVQPLPARVVIPVREDSLGSGVQHRLHKGRAETPAARISGQVEAEEVSQTAKRGVSVIEQAAELDAISSQKAAVQRRREALIGDVANVVQSVESRHAHARLTAVELAQMSVAEAHQRSRVSSVCLRQVANSKTIPGLEITHE
uniref:Uncharacterized protein n=1 Tax=Macrostomum lignano TaxID=282301 RepID=A0A1I8J187_9PLAT